MINDSIIQRYSNTGVFINSTIAIQEYSRFPNSIQPFLARFQSQAALGALFLNKELQLLQQQQQQQQMSRQDSDANWQSQ
jgi:hypothetical protein